MNNLDGTKINKKKWSTGNVAAPRPSSRIHLYHKLETLCGRTAEAFAHQEGATISCPCCKRVLQGKPPDTGKEIIPVDFDYEAWRGEHKPVKKKDPKAPVKKRRLCLPQPSLVPQPLKEQPLTPVPSEPRLSKKPLACGYSYPQGFRHEQPGPEATYQLFMVFRLGDDDKEQVVEQNLCDDCYKSTVRDRNDDQLGQGGRGKIVKVFNLITGEEITQT